MVPSGLRGRQSQPPTSASPRTLPCRVIVILASAASLPPVAILVHAFAPATAFFGCLKVHDQVRLSDRFP